MGVVKSDTITVDNSSVDNSIMDNKHCPEYWSTEECTGYRDTNNTDRATYSGHRDGQVVDKDISISKQVRSAVATLWKQFTQGNYLAITNKFRISFWI